MTTDCRYEARYEVDRERLRGPGLALLAGGLALAHLPASVGLPCPLRSLTGIPCPFCGLTTSVRSLLGGQLRQAALAAPLGLLAVVLAVVAVAGIGPARYRLGHRTLLVALAAEWLFELHRFHALGL